MLPPVQPELELVTTPAAASSDQYGNRFYSIPNPDTGVASELPSVTRLIGILAQPPIEIWKMKAVATGLSRRPDLVALAAADPYQASQQALDAAKEGANMGTALHALTERVDDGTLDAGGVPDQVSGHLENYYRTRELFAWEVVATERTVYNFALGYAGTFDRILRLSELGTVVADIKTGKGVYPEVALQLAALALGEGIWDPETERHEALPEGLRTDLGLVIHLLKTKCKVIPVDLTAAVPAWRAITALAGWRDEKPLGAPLEHEAPSEPTSWRTGGPVDLAIVGRRQWIRSRVKAIIDASNAGHPDAANRLAARWPAGVPTLKDHDGHTPAEIDLIAEACSLTEQETQMPFGDPDPAGLRAPEGIGPDDPRVTGIAERISRLPADSAARLEEWRSVCHLPELDSGEIAADQLEAFAAELAKAEGQLISRDAEAHQCALMLQSTVGLELTELEAVIRLATDGRTAALDKHLTAPELERLNEITDALAEGLLKADGDAVVTVSERAMAKLLELFESKARILAAARARGKDLGRKAPSSAARVAEDPFFVAALVMGRTVDTTQEAA